MRNTNLNDEDIKIIKSYINDGYSDSEIYRLADYTIKQIEYVRKFWDYDKDSNLYYSTSKDNRIFSDNTVNVFCKFLEQGCSNECLYEIFQLWHKVTRESFYKFCYRLRNKETCTYITKNYDIPLKPTRPYKSKFPNKDFISIEYEDTNKITKLGGDDNKIVNKKDLAEIDKIKTQEAIKRKQEELKARNDLTNNIKLKENTNENRGVSQISPKRPDTNDYTVTTVIDQRSSIYSEKTDNDVLRSQINKEKLPNSIVNRICVLIAEGDSDKYISSITNVSESDISAIRNGSEYINISRRYGIIPSDKKNEIIQYYKN